MKRFETFEFKVEGLREVEKFLKEELGAVAARKVTLQALKQSSEGIIDSAKTNARRGRSDALSTSIGIKNVTPGRQLTSGGDTYASIVGGPMSGNKSAWAKYLAYYRRDVRLTDSKGNPNTQYIGRIRHGHLVEFGFRHRSGKHVPARPFLRPAFDTHEADVRRFFAATLRRKAKRVAAKARVKMK